MKSLVSVILEGRPRKEEKIMYKHNGELCITSPQNFNMWKKNIAKFKRWDVTHYPNITDPYELQDFLNKNTNYKVSIDKSCFN